MNKEPMLSNDEEPLPFITKPSDYLPKFEIPLVLKGLKVGVIEAIVLNDEDEFPKIMFSGTLIRELKEPETLVKLLQKEGIHLGKTPQKR